MNRKRVSSSTSSNFQATIARIGTFIAKEMYSESRQKNLKVF